MINFCFVTDTLRKLQESNSRKTEAAEWSYCNCGRKKKSASLDTEQIICCVRKDPMTLLILYPGHDVDLYQMLQMKIKIPIIRLPVIV